MADASEYTTLLAQIRDVYSDYVVSKSADFKNNGISTFEQSRKLVHLNMFTVCIEVLGDFDATVTTHRFTSSEMSQWVNKVNKIANQRFYIDFSQYY